MMKNLISPYELMTRWKKGLVAHVHVCTFFQGTNFQFYFLQNFGSVAYKNYFHLTIPNRKYFSPMWHIVLRISRAVVSLSASASVPIKTLNSPI